MPAVGVVPNWVPKSISVVERGGGVGGGGLWAWGVGVRGLVEVLVRGRAHWGAGARGVGQLWATVKLVAVSWRLVAARLPRLRRVMLGEASVERARLGAA